MPENNGLVFECQVEKDVILSVHWYTLETHRIAGKKVHAMDFVMNCTFEEKGKQVSKDINELARTNVQTEKPAWLTPAEKAFEDFKEKNLGKEIVDSELEKEKRKIGMAGAIRRVDFQFQYSKHKLQQSLLSNSAVNLDRAIPSTERIQELQQQVRQENKVVQFEQRKDRGPKL